MPLTTALLLSGLLAPGFTGCEDEPNPSRVPELIRMLGSKVINVPAEAAQELGQIGPEAKSAIPHLVPLLGDRTVYRDFPVPATVTFEVEWALVQIGVEAVPALAAALKSENEEVVLSAARALGEIGPRAREALPALVQRLNADRHLRRTILESISRIDISGEQATPVLIKRLRDESEDVRAEAAILLARRGRAAEAAVPELLKLLKDPEPRVRGTAAKSLSRIGTNIDQVRPRLIELLDDHNTYLEAISHLVQERSVADDALDALAAYRRVEDIPHFLQAIRDPRSRSYGAMEAIAAFGPRAKDAVPALLERLDEGRLHAATVLVKIGAPARPIVPELRERLDSDDDYVRIAAAIALIGLDPANTRNEREIILAALDPDDLRNYVAQLLGELGPSADFAVPRLVANLKEDELSPWQIATTLGKIGPAAKPAGPILISHLDSWAHNAPVTEALLEIGPDMVPLLVQELESKPESAEFRVGLLQALAAFGPQAGSAVPALVAALDDRCRSVRVAAAAALRHVRTSPERAVPALTHALGDPRPAVRSESARSLGHYGPDAAPAVDPLAAALADEYLDVRLSAAEALARLGPSARPALRSLRQAAKSPNELLRETARHAISQIGSAPE